jgi:hypothetical protein
MALIQGQFGRATIRGQNIMKTRLVPPRRVRRAKDRVEGAKTAARDRAVEKAA